jgi:hypothetical protein
MAATSTATAIALATANAAAIDTGVIHLKKIVYLAPEGLQARRSGGICHCNLTLTPV